MTCTAHSARERRRDPRRGQRGAAALGVTLVLLFLLTILGVLGSRVLVQETRTSANELQAARAFEAAEAGLEYGVAWLNANAGPHAYVADNAAFGGAAACAAASACQRIATDQSLSVGGFNECKSAQKLRFVRNDFQRLFQGLASSIDILDGSIGRRDTKQRVDSSPGRKSGCLQELFKKPCRLLVLTQLQLIHAVFVERLHRQFKIRAQLKG